MNRSSNTLIFSVFLSALVSTGCGTQSIDGTTGTDVSPTDEVTEADTEVNTDTTPDDVTDTSTDDEDTNSEDNTAPADETTPDNGSDTPETPDTSETPDTDSTDTEDDTPPVDETTEPVDEPTDTTDEERESTFVRTTIDDTIAGPSFLTVADLNGDGLDDLVVSAFGQVGLTSLVPVGTITIYYQGSDLETWTTEKLIEQEDAVQFPNGVTIEDIDSDGDLDILSASGFLVCTAIPFGGPCGGLRWYEQDAGSWIEHIILPNEQEHFYHHAELIDFDGDGIRDIIITAEKAGGLFGGGGEAIVQMFQGLSTGDLFSTEPVDLGYGLGSFPRVHDFDADGDLDIASAEYFHEGGSFAWMECIEAPTTNAPAGVFERHVIADDLGPSIMLSLVEDFYGDGELKAVGSNHTNTAKAPNDPESAIYVFDIPDDPTQPWPREKISEGIVSREGNMLDNQAAPGIFGTGDIDGDGDIDVVVSGDGDPRVFWLEQASSGEFTTHVLAEELGQAGAMQIVDLNRDGNNEILVSSYEANVLYIYQYETN